ncbi:hypothetical protein [Paludibacterium denitrificans]|uniref:hypothetical protein n=1 Tax=Paludibacterium denitrificans TaxID=2675226 RepID=UPI001E49CE35|nr:hypothetical protein [Paludibacterium denitrificans]
MVKGAPEDILRLSVRYEVAGDGTAQLMDETVRAAINQQFEALSQQGFRVLGIASRQVGKDHPHAVVSDETELVFALPRFSTRPRKAPKRR